MSIKCAWLKNVFSFTPSIWSRICATKIYTDITKSGTYCLTAILTKVIFTRELVSHCQISLLFLDILLDQSFRRQRHTAKLYVVCSLKRYVCIRVWTLGSVIKQSTYYKHSTRGKCCVRIHFCVHCNRSFKERQLLSKLLLLRLLSLITKKCIIYFTNSINYHRNVPYNITSQAIRGTNIYTVAETTGLWLTLCSQAHSSICKFLYLTYK